MRITGNRQERLGQRKRPLLALQQVDIGFLCRRAARPSKYDLPRHPQRNLLQGGGRARPFGGPWAFTNRTVGSCQPHVTARRGVARIAARRRRTLLIHRGSFHVVPAITVVFVLARFVWTETTFADFAIRDRFARHVRRYRDFRLGNATDRSREPFLARVVRGSVHDRRWPVDFDARGIQGTLVARVALGEPHHRLRLVGAVASVDAVRPEAARLRIARMLGGFLGVRESISGAWEGGSGRSPLEHLLLAVPELATEGVGLEEKEEFSKPNNLYMNALKRKIKQFQSNTSSSIILVDLSYSRLNEIYVLVF